MSLPTRMSLSDVKRRINEIKTLSDPEGEPQEIEVTAIIENSPEETMTDLTRRFSSRGLNQPEPPPPPPASRAYYSETAGRSKSSSSSPSPTRSHNSPEREKMLRKKREKRKGERKEDREDEERRGRQKERERYRYGSTEPSPGGQTPTESMYSAQSVESGDRKGLERVFLRVVKPIGTLIDVKARNDPTALNRARKHLDRVTGPSIKAALHEEQLDGGDAEFKATVLKMLKNVTDELDELKQENMQKGKTLITKSRNLKPNLPDTYPSYNADKDAWQKAVRQLEIAVKNTERLYPLREAPYDFLLEIAGNSNTIAANFGLSKRQQRELIQATVPNTHPLYTELLLCESLEEVFQFASINSSSIPTKAETEASLDNWSIDLRSFPQLNESIGRLKQLIIDAQQWDYGPDGRGINKRLLFEMMVQKIRKGPVRIPKFVESKLESFLIDIQKEKSPVAMHELLIGILRHLVISNQQRPLPQKPKVFLTGLANAQEDLDSAEPPSFPSNDPQSTGARKKMPDKSRPQGYDRKGGRFNSRPKSRARTVRPWPRNKEYKNKSGTKLYPEIEAHFKDFCFRCGLSNHSASQCRFYPERTPILTLCDLCHSGFHDKCKHPHFKEQRQAQDGKADGNSPAVLKKLEALVDRWSIQPPPPIGFAAYGALPLPFNNTNSPSQPTVKQPDSESDSE